ncbi:THAP domain-containing protein 6-like isoform 1-T1 [Pholidichthys leucotaenia]
MPQFCAVVGCANKGNRQMREQGITFHKFPKDKDRRFLWKAALRRKDFEPSNCTVICSHHFKPEDFDRTGQTTRIREGVVPSIFFSLPRIKALGKPRTSRTSQKAAAVLPPDQLQPTKILKEPVRDTATFAKEDHQYAIDPDNVKKRLNEAQVQLQELRRDLRNAKDRERRHKQAVKVLMQDLKSKHMLTEEVKRRLKLILV